MDLILIALPIAVPVVIWYTVQVVRCKMAYRKYKKIREL